MNVEVGTQIPNLLINVSASAGNKVPCAVRFNVEIAPIVETIDVYPVGSVQARPPAPYAGIVRVESAVYRTVLVSNPITESFVVVGKGVVAAVDPIQAISIIDLYNNKFITDS